MILRALGYIIPEIIKATKEFAAEFIPDIN